MRRFTSKNVSPYRIVLGLIAILSSGCNVVIPNWQSEAIFGYTTSGDYDPLETYAVGLYACETELYPNILFPTENAAPSAGYLATLNAAFPAWTFTTATTDLSDDSIEIKTYDVIGTSTQVGVWIHATYVPHGGDPTDDLHWVQVLTTNHGLKGTGHGAIVTYEDVHSTATTPYYDDGYAADDRDLLDRPSRSDATADHTWEATTYLATGPDVGDPAGTVTILVPGFTWGFKNTCAASDGIMQYHYVVEQAESFQLVRPLEPGGKLQLVSEALGPMMLGKDKARTPVQVLSSNIEFEIDERIDLGGLSALDNARGEIKFGAARFEDRNVPAMTAEISRGSGSIHWESGEAVLQFVVSITLPDGKAENMVFTGTGVYDKEANSFRINPNLTGISERFLRENVPTDRRKDEEKRGASR